MIACGREGTAQPLDHHTLFCPIVSRLPSIDGVVDDDEWRNSVTIDQLRRSGSSVQARETVAKDTTIRLMADESNLYVAFECSGPDGAPQDPQHRTRDGLRPGDRVFQVFVDANHDHKTNRMFGTDCLGTQSDAANAGTGHKGGNDRRWNANWQSATIRGESTWSGEMAIPLRELSGAAIGPGSTFGINFVRRRPEIPCVDFLKTSPLARSRVYWSNIFADVICGAPGVVVSTIDLPVWRQGMNSFDVELHNHAAVSETVVVSCRSVSNAGKEVWAKARVTLQPDSTRQLRLSGRVIGDWENAFGLTLTRAETNEQLYSATWSKLVFGPHNLRFAPEQAVDELGNPWDIATSVDVRQQPDSFDVTLSPAGSHLAAKAAAVLTVRTEVISENTGAPVCTEEFRLLSGTPLHAVAGTAGLPDGGYVFRISISQSTGKPLLKTGHYFVCVGQEYPDLKADLISLRHRIEQHPYRSESLKYARSSFMFLEYLIKEAAKVVEAGTIADTFSSSAYRRNLDLAQESVLEAKTLAEVFENDTDPLASKRGAGTASNADPLSGTTGVIQRAYLSTFHRELRPYTVFVPSTYDPARPTPLISLMLTPGPSPDWRSSPAGRGSMHSESLALAEKKGYLIVWPTGRRLEAEVNFFDVLREMKQDYNIDEDRIYMMGVSGGGLASWLIGLRFPDQIAAICPISALTVVSESTERPEKASTALLRERSVYHFPMNALHVPVIMLHGDADTTTLCDVQARPMAKRMNELGLELEYVEYPGAGHGLGDSYAKGFARALAFFGRHRNERHPRTIDYSTPGMRYNKAYWIRIGSFQEKGRFARVQASAEGNTVEITTENVAGFSILRDEVVFDVSTPVTVSIDGAVVYEGLLPMTGGAAFTLASGGVWQSK